MDKENAEYFHKFGLLMVQDSKILYKNNSFHNSVYFAVFALEAYLKILLLNNNKTYRGHISENFLNRFNTIESGLFKLDKFSNMIDDYDINDRYEVNKWIDKSKCEKIQNELNSVEALLRDLEIGFDLQ